MMGRGNVVFGLGLVVGWTLAGNWLGGAPADSLVTDSARFNQTSYAFQPTAPSPRRINGLTINGSGSGGILIDGLIVNGGTIPQANGSPVTLIINSTGSHVTTISGVANTFTGGLTLVAGTLAVVNNDALGGSLNTVTIQGGTLDRTNSFGKTAASSFKLDGDFIFTSSGGGQYSMTGTNTPGGRLTVLNLTVSRKIAQCTGTVLPGRFDAVSPAYAATYVSNGNEVWVRKMTGTMLRVY